MSTKLHAPELEGPGASRRLLDDVLDELGLREEDRRWFYGAGAFDDVQPIALINLAGPVLGHQRRKFVEDALGAGAVLDLLAFSLAQRTLTPRRPFIEFPRTVLSATGRSWNLSAQFDALEWSGTGDSPRPAFLGLGFNDIRPGSRGLITVEITAAAHQDTTGQIAVAARGATPRSFPVASRYHAHYTLDLIVTATHGHTWLNLEVDESIRYLGFHSATYSPLA